MACAQIPRSFVAVGVMWPRTADDEQGMLRRENQETWGLGFRGVSQDDYKGEPGNQTTSSTWPYTGDEYGARAS